MSNEEDLWKDYKWKDYKRHSNISFAIEGLGLEGIVGDIISEEVDDMIDRYNLTHKDIERYKENRSSFYDETGKMSDPFCVVETFIVNRLTNELYEREDREQYTQ